MCIDRHVARIAIGHVGTGKNVFGILFLIEKNTLGSEGNRNAKEMLD